MTLDRDQLTMIHSALAIIHGLSTDPTAKILLNLLLSLIDEFERQTRVSP